MKEQIQSVIITLSDGRKGIFTGKKLLDAPSNKLGVTNVQFTEPIELPDDCAFEAIGALK